MKWLHCVGNHVTSTVGLTLGLSYLFVRSSGLEKRLKALCTGSFSEKHGRSCNNWHLFFNKVRLSMNTRFLFANNLLLLEAGA